MPSSDDLAGALARLGMGRPNPDAEIRPLLLRIVVDLFLQKRHHPPADIRSFEAIVGPLLSDIDTVTRQRLIGRLIDHPATPAALLERLMDDERLIATDLYRHAAFDEAALLTAAVTGPTMAAASIAQQGDLSAAIVRALVGRRELQVAAALVDNAAIAFEPAALEALVALARSCRDLAERLAVRVVDPLAIAPLFPLLSQHQRHRIIEALCWTDLGRRQWGRPDGATTATLARLNQLALAGEWDSFDDALCLAVEGRASVLRPFLHEGGGDVLAVALAAVGATGEVAARIFILGDPAIGRSVTTVRRLTTLVDTLAPTAARRLLEAMLGAQTETHRPVADITPVVGRRGDAVPTAARREIAGIPPRRMRR